MKPWHRTGLALTAGALLLAAVTCDEPADPSYRVPAAHAGGPYRAVEGRPIAFDGSASTDPAGSTLTYAWDYGDGASGTEPAPTHIYTAAGSYTITLTVTNARGAHNTASTTVEVGRPPVASAGGPYSATEGRPLQLDGGGSTDPEGGTLSYAWEYGDGASGTEPAPTHIYTAAGSYTVTLVVTNARGVGDTAATTVDVRKPPVANAGGPYSGTEKLPLQLDGGRSSNPDGGTLAYTWQFGDGATGTGVRPTHTYQTAGNYTITLTVANSRGVGDTALTTVKIGKPPIADAGGPYSATEGRPLQLDGGGSTDPEGGTLTYAWKFGDGTSGTGAKPTHTYKATGRYTVTLTVTNTLGASDTATATVEVGEAPVANAGGTYTGTEKRPIQLDGSGSTDPAGDSLTYAWAFGDGGIGTGAKPMHTYQTAGSYTVALTVTNSRGVGDTATTTVKVGKPPIANPGGPYSGTEGKPVQLDGTGSSDPEGGALTYAWTFGDGGTGTGAQPTHTYAANKSYTVTLTVTDPTGAADTATTTATIANASPSVNAGPDATIAAGWTFNLSATFSDPGKDDAPWSYTITWGDGATQNGTTSDQSARITGKHTYASTGSYTIRVKVEDKDGGDGQDDLKLTVVSGTTVLAAGDIAGCDADTYDEATAAMLDGLSGMVLALGDQAYDKGTIEEYNNCFEPTWGRHKTRTWPSLGNHEYKDPLGGASGYFQYWSFKDWSSMAGNPSKGYYSFDLAAWHVIILNSNCRSDESGGCKEGSAQLAWLKADLAANSKRCTLAVFHHPRFWSNGSEPGLRDVWVALYDAGADLILNAHQHNYERFAPMTPDGVLDPERGIRQITVGTGGMDVKTHGTPPAPNSEVRGKEFGLLKLTLAANAYTWEFIPVPGLSGFTDSGGGTCH